MTPRSLSVLMIAVVASACGDGGQTVSSDLAAQLAGRADAVAELVDQGDGCAALEAIGSLRQDVESAASEDLPRPLAEELLAAVSDLEGQVPCEPPDPEPADDERHEEDDDDEDDEGRGRGRGNGPPDDRGKDD